jgi:hypothetical protein
MTWYLSQQQLKRILTLWGQNFPSGHSNLVSCEEKVREEHNIKAMTMNDSSFQFHLSTKKSLNTYRVGAIETTWTLHIVLITFWAINPRVNVAELERQRQCLHQRAVRDSIATADETQGAISIVLSAHKGCLVFSGGYNGITPAVKSYRAVGSNGKFRPKEGFHGRNYHKLTFVCFFVFYYIA